MEVLEFLNENFDFGDGIDVWTRYFLIIANAIMIIIILIVKHFRKGEVNNQEVPKNVLFVTAHPDDEAMFFLPTIQELKKQNYKLHLLCFSNGGSEGLGRIREEELEKCGQFLKFEKVTTLNEPDIVDGMTTIWPIERMAVILNNYIKENNISGVFTFDDYGVSGHANHRDIYRSVRILKQKYPEETKDIKFFQLESVNLLRKYISGFDIVFCLFSEHTFLNYNPFLAWKAMNIHYSQFVWFRKLFVIFSRYAYINTLKPLK